MLAIYIILGVLIVLLMAFLTVRLVWNVRLQQFQKRSGIQSSSRHKMAFGSNIAALSLLFVVGGLMLAGGLNSLSSSKPKLIVINKHQGEVKTQVNAKAFESEEELEKILKIVTNNNGLRDEIQWVNTGAPKDGTALPDIDNGKSVISDTYEQVAGVSEADIAKVQKDGKYLYYGPRFLNHLYRLPLDDKGNHVGEFDQLDFDTTFKFQEMLLHERYLIVFGIIYKEFGIDGDRFDFETIHSDLYYGKSMYYIIDLEEFTVVKEEVVNGYIEEVRLVGDLLFVVSKRWLRSNDNRLMTKEELQNVYYFKGEINSAALTLIKATNLKTLETTNIGFFGDMQGFYMSQNYILLATSKWVFSDLRGYTNKSTIIAVKYDAEGNMTYRGSKEVEGIVLNQYSMDERKDYFRIVTTYGPNHRNSLYILKEDQSSDELVLVSSILEGIGKPGEDVKSVDFQETSVRIVTFRQIDPLYIINLTNPEKPFIEVELEEPGFSSGLIDFGNDTFVGIGRMADFEGRIIGIKVSAYKYENGILENVQNIEFPFADGEYITAQALDSMRQNLLVNKEIGLLGFIATGIFNDPIIEDEGHSLYRSKVLLFKVDFAEEDPLSLLVISKKSFVERLEKIVLVNEMIHVLSPNVDFMYNLPNSEWTEELRFIKYQPMPVEDTKN